MEIMEIQMPHERFVAALRRIRAQIANGLKLDYVDSDQTGNKYTHCSWGLCSENKAQWPDAEDHLWPDQFTNEGRVAPLYSVDDNECPFVERPHDGSGCFYRCRIFQKKNPPNKEEAIRLYDIRIGEHEEKTA